MKEMMQAQQAKFEEFFKEREQQIIKHAVSKAVEAAETEIGLLKFELFSSAAISEKETQKISRLVRKQRSMLWKEALKKASGDKEKAIKILCS